ncbi:SDR family NAD(P)-dependent oxidoreductase [Phenylobacterium sp.]|jgi:NAD(P)-dependent dehydrogenase (short-subunit alcohol dehydrogenase family)|uniref:SDR family NAD(P)-dependent oxidoreductase n=1 Tax=Phenylobacterium sp. TaxID=1871053 RepID=UPI002E365F2C|nr:SDR family NAD(P)-dependent oxidoreductase [Phenylobacterium sp.]HEX3364638.1 SDR family NAD(P)-dependent oxidoreductase [Phenylobacterium sp.]
MRDLAGKAAFITGAASGIGLGIARALAKQGVDIVLADVDADGLQTASAQIATLGVRAIPVTLDISDPKAWRGAVDIVRGALPTLHILVNNAGVVVPARPIQELPDTDFEWLFAVNVFGLFHGIKTFLPILQESGQGGHIVNTASTAGFLVSGDPKVGAGVAYNATKSAVVSLTEGLRISLAGSGIGVSLLAPGAVRTGFDRVGRLRPEKYGGPRPEGENALLADVLKAGVDPDFVGERVVYGILNDEAYIFTNPRSRAMIETRFQTVLEAFGGLDGFLATQAELTD